MSHPAHGWQRGSCNMMSDTCNMMSDTCNMMSDTCNTMSDTCNMMPCSGKADHEGGA